MRQDALLGGGAFVVLRNVGQLMLYLAALPLLLLPVAFYYGESNAYVPILATSAIQFATGFLLSRLPSRREPRLREGMLIAALGWLAIPLGSVPPFILLEGWTFVDSLFETMSAWTGTGMTMADVTQLHRTTLFWRSLMQWVGGLGVIVLTLAILARPGTGAHTLYVGEAREDKLRPSVLSTVRLLWRIYILVTLAGIAVLMIAGLPGWDAVNHGLTAIATGGMSTNNDSVAPYSPVQQMAFVPIMIVGSIPFVVTYALFRGRWRDLVRDEQVRALFLALLLLGAFLLWRLHDALDWRENPGILAATIFQTVSAVTTTGFQSMSLTDWAPAEKVAIVGFMLLGGAAGSTAGGLKLFRGVLLFKGALWKLNRSGLPHFAVTSFDFGGRRLDQREANEEFAEAAFILVLVSTLLFVSFVALLTLAPPQERVVDTLFDIASAVGNNGIVTGIIGPQIETGAKLALVFVMWAGRLEVLPVLLLVRGLIPRR